MALTDVLGKGPRPGPDTKERQRRVVRRRKRNQFGMDWGGSVEKKKKKKKRRVGGYWVVVMATGICVCVRVNERAREPGKGKNKHTTMRRKKGKRCTSHVWERQRASDPKKGSRYSIPP